MTENEPGIHCYLDVASCPGQLLLSHVVIYLCHQLEWGVGQIISDGSMTAQASQALAIRPHRTHLCQVMQL